MPYGRSSGKTKIYLRIDGAAKHIGMTRRQLQLALNRLEEEGIELPTRVCMQFGGEGHRKLFFIASALTEFKPTLWQTKVRKKFKWREYRRRG